MLYQKEKIRNGRAAEPNSDREARCKPDRIWVVAWFVLAVLLFTTVARPA